MPKLFVTQEKRTDVNIATHLVNDAHKKMFDIAVVVTNDSDLLELFDWYKAGFKGWF